MGCECPVAGFCERHKIHKHEAWHRLCQTRQDYFNAWEKGKGPGQMSSDAPYKPKRQRIKGVGDFLHSALEKWGIKEEYGCSCESHRVSLNAWGPKVCKEHVETIVDWMAKEAEKRKMLFIRFKARQLVHWSIKQAEKEIARFKNLS